MKTFPKNHDHHRRHPGNHDKWTFKRFLCAQRPKAGKNRNERNVSPIGGRSKMADIKTRTVPNHTNRWTDEHAYKAAKLEGQSRKRRCRR